MKGQVEIFYHVRALLGVVLALGVTRILSGLPQFMKHRREKPLSLAHLFWVGTIILMAVHFWWFEYTLINVPSWHFELYLFVLFYAFLFTLFAAVLVPDDVGEHRDYDAYFIAHRYWFFGLLGATVPVDLVDTLMKGGDYYQSLGIEYPVRLVVLMALCLVAGRTTNRRFHVIFAGTYFAYYLSWIVRLYDVLE